jgi:DNA-binding NarL/FixJ family response regulator
MIPKIRVLLADDHETVRQGLRALLEKDAEVEVVGDVADAASAVESARIHTPDLVVLDISMPKRSGLSTISQITTAHPETRIVVLTRHRDPAFVRDALSSGASGYVLKQSPFSELRLAIDKVWRGESHIDGGVMAPEVPRPTGGFRAFRITDRERDVLRRTALGHSHKDMAAALGLAVKTIEVHKANAMRKLGLRDRRDLIRFAAAQDWLRDS